MEPIIAISLISFVIITLIGFFAHWFWNPRDLLNESTKTIYNLREKLQKAEVLNEEYGKSLQDAFDELSAATQHCRHFENEHRKNRKAFLKINEVVQNFIEEDDDERTNETNQGPSE